MNITDAVLENTPALVALWGPSGSGKTLSAILIARGLVGPNGKIGVIDTENKRAKFYAQHGGGWRHLDLQPPFSPMRYIEAFDALIEDGCDCIIVDSMSHMWEGDGGVIDMADNNAFKGLQKWNAPKKQYKKANNKITRSPVHMIFTLRAKRHFLQVGKDVQQSGLSPICGDRFVHEMTASFLMGPDCKPVIPGKSAAYEADPLTPTIKITDGMAGIVERGAFLGEHTGKMISEYLAHGSKVDHHAEEVLSHARDVASLGIESLTKHAEGMEDADKAILRHNWAELKAISSNCVSVPTQNDDEMFPND